jgi:sec-independent protein translocase protein TatA
VGGFLGFWEILIIAIVLLLVFGPKRVPQLGRRLGQGLREVRNALPSSHEEPEEKAPAEQKPRAEQKTHAELTTRERDSLS